MVIDIISYSDEQFAAMTDEQLLEVQSAQMKKNRLMAALEEDLRKEKYRLIDNGTYLSSMWPLIQEKLQKAYEQEVDLIRDALLFYLRFSTHFSKSIQVCEFYTTVSIIFLSYIGPFLTLLHNTIAQTYNATFAQY